MTNVKAIPGIECVQQHRLVTANLNLWVVKKHKKKFVPKLKLRKLKEEDSRADFNRRMLEQENIIEEASGQEAKWSRMKESWMKNAEEVCGWTKGGHDFIYCKNIDSSQWRTFYFPGLFWFSI